MTMPIAIVIEAVQHTPDREPVVIQYSAQRPSTGPLASTQQLHTTQAALAARSGIPDYWSDTETKAELLAYLEAHGITAEIVPNVDAPQPDVPVAPTRLQAAQSDPRAMTSEADA
jgi:hypothetical protein